MKFLKTILAILIILAIVLSAAYYFRDFFLGRLVEDTIERNLGLEIRMGRFKSFPFKGKYILKQVTIENPTVFKRRQLAYLPHIAFIVDNGSLFKDKKPEIKLVDFTVEKMNIIKDKENRVNLELVAQTIEKSQFFKEYVPIRLLRFRVRDVFFIDEASKKSEIRAYPVQTGSLVYENADSMEDVLDVLFKEIISRVKFKEAVNILKSTLFDNIQNVTMVPTDTVKLVIETPLLLLGGN